MRTVFDQTVITKVSFAMRPVPLDMQLQMQIMKAPIILQHDFLGVWCGFFVFFLHGRQRLCKGPVLWFCYIWTVCVELKMQSQLQCLSFAQS